MKESEARTKFLAVLQHLDLDEPVKEIYFCENKLSGALGKVKSVVEYDIWLDKLLLIDPEKLEREWTDRISHFPDGVVPSLPKDDRIFLVFLHEVGHIVNRHCLKDPPLEDSPEEYQREEEAWDFAWMVYRAYRAGQEQAD